MDDEPTKSLWIRAIELKCLDNIVVSVCYRPSEQEEVLGRD